MTTKEHIFKYDEMQTRFARDVLFYRCINCNYLAEISGRSLKPQEEALAIIAIKSKCAGI